MICEYDFMDFLFTCVMLQYSNIYLGLHTFIEASKSLN